MIPDATEQVFPLGDRAGTTALATITLPATEPFLMCGTLMVCKVTSCRDS